jgi:DNA-binding response OmpR family regulator
MPASRPLNSPGDHGSGIPEDFKPRIFEKFAQADGTNSLQKGGTGLGLSIVKQIVERLSGQVGFDEAPGGGTIFHVELPRSAGAAGEIDVAAEGAPPRILLCEDDPAVAKVVRMRLRRAGFTVDFAHTVDTAIARSDTNRYAAIIVDLRFRGSDGIDLILQIRAQSHHSNTPIVVISGDAERGRGDVIIRSPQLNVLCWFNKPIDFGRLTEVLVAATSPKSRARPRILHVDDDRDILAVVARELATMGDVVSADTAEDALRILAGDSFDLVVLDIALGQDSALDLLPDIRDRFGNAIPVIIFSCHGGDVPCDDQINTALSKMNSSLENLGAAVRDRLALLPAWPVKEFA